MKDPFHVLFKPFLLASVKAFKLMDAIKQNFGFLKTESCVFVNERAARVAVEKALGACAAITGSPRRNIERERGVDELLSR